jgi:hypothetical protein
VYRVADADRGDQAGDLVVPDMCVRDLGEAVEPGGIN